jgi:hypothetical protein
MKTIAGTIGVALALGALWSTPAAAQDPRLARLTPEARGVVLPVIDSAVVAGLPAEPLVNRALEGASKGAPAPLIAAAVRRLAADLGRSREVLGPAAGPNELAAAADALRAGASPGVLERLRDALGSRRLAVPLGVTADLTARGVPADTAATLVITLARSVEDAQLLAVQREVERDIALGAPPLAAAAGRLAAEALAAADFAANAPRSNTGGNTGPPPAPRKP